MIKVIAEDIDKNFRDTHFGFFYQLQIQPDSNSTSAQSYHLTFHPISFFGYTHYRGFPLQDVLFPDRWGGIIQLVHKKDSIIRDQWKIESGASTHLNRLVVHSDFTSGFIDTDSLVLDSMQFNYSKEGYALFESRIQQINDYYTASRIIDSLLILENKLKFKECGKLPLDFIHLWELNRMVILLLSRDLENSLHLDGWDTLHYQRRLEELRRFSLSASMSFRQVLDTCEKIEMGQAIDSVADAFVKGMLKYIRWSLYSTWQTGLLYQDYLDSYFKYAAREKDIEVVKVLMRKIMPDLPIDSSMRVLTSDICRAYEMVADQLIEMNQHAEAVALLENQRLFLTFNPYAQRQDRQSKAFVKAVNGIYSSYLDVASKALERGKLSLASAYLEKAKKYRSEFPEIIQKDSIGGKLTKQYFADQLKVCDSICGKNQFEEALLCLSEFEQNLDTVSSILLKKEVERRNWMARRGLALTYLKECSLYIKNDQGDSAIQVYQQVQSLTKHFPADRTVDSLLNRYEPDINRMRYNSMMDRATLAFELRQFSNAYELCLQASAIPLTQRNGPDPRLDSILYLSYPQYLIDQISLAEVKIWSNNLDQAKKYIDSVQLSTVQKGYMNNPQLNAFVAQYNRKIEQRVCWNAKDTIEMTFLRACENLAIRRFQRAEQLLKETKRLVDRYERRCQLPRQAMDDTIQKYARVFEFIKYTSRQDGFLSIGEFDSVVSLQHQLETSFNQYKLAKYGLHLDSLYTKAVTVNNQRFTIYLLQYCITRNLLDQGVTYLILLKSQGYPESESRTMQIELATQLAQRDLDRSPKGDSAVRLKRYVDSDKWFAIFEKTYREKVAK